MESARSELAALHLLEHALRFAGIVAMGFHPIPYYIVAFVLLIVFGFLWPVLPISGAYDVVPNRRGYSFTTDSATATVGFTTSGIVSGPSFTANKP